VTKEKKFSKTETRWERRASSGCGTCRKPRFERF